MKRLQSPVWLVFLSCLLIPAISKACLWDSDTIQMERSRFPSTLELITGKFLRHSPEFYQWRIANRLKRLENDPKNLQLLDDLAVAYDKVGQQKKAIEIGLKTDQIQPNRYETLANLGTFYIHAGQFQEGLKYIDRAIAINPNAHFGREIFQKYLVEYIIECRKNVSNQLPLKLHPSAVNNDEKWKSPSSFMSFVKQKMAPDATKVDAELRQKTLTGILGIMKFGKHDSPIILEVLADVLSDEFPELLQNASLLAGRAYLKAAMESTDEKVKAEYRSLASGSISYQPMYDINQLESDFKSELEEAATWYSELRERELSWIRDGLDADAEFAKLYHADPVVTGLDEQATTPEASSSWLNKIKENAVLYLVIIAVSTIGVLFGFKLLKRA